MCPYLDIPQTSVKREHIWTQKKFVMRGNGVPFPKDQHLRVVGRISGALALLEDALAQAGADKPIAVLVPPKSLAEIAEAFGVSTSAKSVLVRGIEFRST